MNQHPELNTLVKNAMNEAEMSKQINTDRLCNSEGNRWHRTWAVDGIHYAKMGPMTYITDSNGAELSGGYHLITWCGGDSFAATLGKRVSAITCNWQGEKKTMDKQINEVLNKPVYTQEMADAGELPPVGAEFEIAVVINNGALLSKWGPAVIKGIYGEEFWIKTADENIIKNRNGFRFRPLPAKTPKDLATEDMARIMVPVEDGLINDVSLGALYDAGYRKQMPEDEMHSAILATVLKFCDNMPIPSAYMITKEILKALQGEA